MNILKKLFAFSLLLCLAGLAAGSELYPDPAKWSLQDVAGWAQPRILSGPELPEIASAATGDIFILTAPLSLWRAIVEPGPNQLPGIATWSQLSGSEGGSGVANHSGLSELDYSVSGHTGFAATSDIPVAESFSHDYLSDVATSSGHDGKYGQLDAPNIWSAGHLNQFLGPIEINDSITTPDVDGRLILYGGPGQTHGASIFLGGSSATEGPRGGVVIQADPLYFLDTDPVAGDSAISFITGVNPKTVENGGPILRAVITASGALKLIELPNAPIDPDSFDATNSVFATGTLFIASSGRLLQADRGGFSQVSLEGERRGYITTELGGYAVKMLATGTMELVRGEIVRASTFGDEYCSACPTSSQEPIGVVYSGLDGSGGVPVGSYAWVVVSGIAEINAGLDGFSAGNLILTSSEDYGCGMAASAIPPTTQAEHNREIGHAITSAPENGMGKVILHFN